MARSDAIKEIANAYVRTLWRYRDARQRHLRTHRKKAFVDLVNDVVEPKKKLAYTELKDFNRYVNEGLDAIDRARVSVIEGMSPEDYTCYGTGPSPKSTFGSPPDDDDDDDDDDVAPERVDEDD